MSALIVPVLIAILELSAVVIGLGGVSLVANRLPTVTETMLVLVTVSTAVVVGVVWLLMPAAGPAPRFVEPATYGTPAVPR